MKSRNLMLGSLLAGLFTFMNPTGSGSRGIQCNAQCIGTFGNHDPGSTEYLLYPLAYGSRPEE